MQDVKPGGNGTAASVQSGAPDAATPGATLPVTNPPALIPQPPLPSDKPAARSNYGFG